MRPGDVVWYIMVSTAWRCWNATPSPPYLPKNHTRSSDIHEKVMPPNLTNKVWLPLPLHYKRWNRPAEFNRMIYGNVDDVGVRMQERTLSPIAPVRSHIYFSHLSFCAKMSAFGTKEHKIKMEEMGNAKKKGKRWWIAQPPRFLFLYDLFLAWAP